jgi:hypothetical protein
MEVSRRSFIAYGITTPAFGALALQGCQPATDFTALISAVQQIAAETCKFLPLAETIIALIPTYGPVAATIAKSICTAVHPLVASGKMGGKYMRGDNIKIGNVSVRGYFLE